MVGLVVVPFYLELICGLGVSVAGGWIIACWMIAGVSGCIGVSVSSIASGSDKELGIVVTSDSCFAVGEEVHDGISDDGVW